MNETWKKIGTFLGEREEGVFHFDADGQIHGSASFWLMIGTLSEIILNSMAKHTMSSNEFKEFHKEILKETKKTATKTAEEIAIQSFRLQAEFSPVECPECGHLNPPESCYCNKCGYDFNIE